MATKNKISSRTAFKIADGYEINPLFSLPVNGECYCGSGKKFKKCCYKKTPRYVPTKLAEQTRDLIKKERSI